MFEVMFIFALTIYAGMVKLVDMPDLGSGAARRVGSSPITRTKGFSKEKLFYFKTFGAARRVSLLATRLPALKKL